VSAVQFTPRERAIIDGAVRNILGTWSARRAELLERQERAAAAHRAVLVLRELDAIGAVPVVLPERVA
jgi:hypothetical protein